MRTRLGLALASAVLVAACGSTSPTAAPASAAPGATPGASTAAASAPAETVTLNLRHCWGGDAEMAAMQSVVDKWNAANPDKSR